MPLVLLRALMLVLNVMVTVVVLDAFALLRVVFTLLLSIVVTPVVLFALVVRMLMHMNE